MWKATVWFLLLGLAGLKAQEIRLQATETNRIFTPLIHGVLEKAGFQPTTTTAVLARMQNGLNNRTIDGVYLIGDASLEATDGLKVPIVLYRNEVVAVSIRPGIVVRSSKDLAKYRIGILKGNKDQLELAKAVAHVELNADYTTMMRKLAGGRFDVAVTSRMLVCELMLAQGIRDYKIHAPALRSYPLYFALSQERAAWKDRIAAAFQVEIDNGRWKKMMGRALSASCLEYPDSASSPASGPSRGGRP